MATDVTPLCVKVRIAVLIKLGSCIDLSFFAAATLPFALTVALFLCINPILSALFFLFMSCALFHHAVCKSIGSRSEPEGGASILIYFLCCNATGDCQGYKREQ